MKETRVYSRDFLLLLSILTLIPLAFSSSFYTSFLVPKVVLLYVLAPLLLCSLKITFLPHSNLFICVSTFFAATALSAAFASDPVPAISGSHFNHMGLITLLCIYMGYLGVVYNLWGRRERVEVVMLVVGCVGTVVGFYGVAQYFGIDPFKSSGLGEERLFRAVSTLGHANYLGNYLLYALPLALWAVVSRSGWMRIVLGMGVWAMVVAILLSGTRGAWIGMVVGLGLFVFLQKQVLSELKRYLAVVLIGLLLIVFLSASSLIVDRVKSFRDEGFTGSGRTLLWRDSLRMLPDYLLTGCGPEGYRREFLRYKSRELTLISPDINNESSHNAYLDAFLSFGLVGGLAYLALIGLAFRSLYRSFRVPEKRLAAASVMAALTEVCIHNLFIYDQLATGLYFFSFIGLVQALESVGASSAPDRRLWWMYAVRALAGISLVISGSYAVSLMLADMEARMLVEAVKRNDYRGIVRYGENAVSSLEPTGAYRVLYANALGLYALRPRSERRDQTLCKRAWTLQ